MRNFFSISLSLLVLVSGMHLSFATHICGGKVAADKWSFTGEEATCGMETPEKTYPTGSHIDPNCCHNYIANLTVDNNYNPSSFQIKEVTKNLIHVFFVPVSFSFHSQTTSNSFYTDVGPHHILQTSAVSLVEICVFRV